MKFISLLLIAISFSLIAKEYKFKDYDQAKEANEFVKFESESTKFGFITTGFDGYAKSFKVDFNKKDKTLNGLVVKIDAASFDTDNGSRDEKMFEQTLSVKKYPYVVFKADEAITLSAKPITVSGKLKVRDQERSVKLSLVIKKSKNVYTVIGKTQLSLKEFKIPDPSIAIANVRDDFDISFRININE